MSCCIENSDGRGLRGRGFFEVVKGSRNREGEEEEVRRDDLIF